MWLMAAATTFGGGRGQGKRIRKRTSEKHMAMVNDGVLAEFMRVSWTCIQDADG